MGIPGLIITEEMVPHLQEILTSAGIKAEKETYPEEHGTVTLPQTPDGKQLTLNIPNFSLHCENQQGERVNLTFNRSPSEPYELGIAVRPLPQSLWKTFIKMQKNKLVDQIIVILKKHGAKEFEDVLGNMKQQFDVIE